MNVIEQVRKLGVEIQKDERFIRYAKAKLANDKDSDLQDKIGKFNVIRMELDKEVNADPRNEEKVTELNEKLRSIYGDVMACDAMVEYNTAKAEVDALMAEINTVISKSLDGEDPMTCETSSGCTGSCSSCGGCH